MKSKGLSRRDFLKMAGMSAAVPVVTFITPVLGERVVSAASILQQASVITIATSSGSRPEALNRYAAQVLERTGITIDVQDSSDWRARVTADFVAGGGSYDVIIAPFLFMKDWFVAGNLASLQPYVDADSQINVDDFIGALMSTYNWNQDEVYSFPFQGDTFLSFYRKDIFEDPAIQAAYLAATGNELVAPQTVEQQLEVAEYFTRSLNPDSPIEFGFTNWSERWGSVWWWGIRMSTLGGGWLDQNNHPNMNNEAGLRALRDYKAMHAFAPADVITYDWDPSNTSFLDGRSLMLDQWNGFGSLTQTEESTSGASTVIGKVGYALPTGYEVDGSVVNHSILGGWTSSASANSRNLEGAYKVIAELTSREAELSRIDLGFAPCRLSTYDGLELTPQTEFFPVQAEAFEVSNITADVDGAPISQILQDMMATQIHRVLLGELEPEQALEDVDREWTSLLQDAGIYG